MTEEEKNIVLLGSRYETMNMYVDLSNDDGIVSKGIAEAMQVYAERYHIAQTKKLHQPTVINLSHKSLINISENYNNYLNFEYSNIKLDNQDIEQFKKK